MKNFSKKNNFLPMGMIKDNIYNHIMIDNWWQIDLYFKKLQSILQGEKSDSDFVAKLTKDVEKPTGM